MFLRIPALGLLCLPLCAQLGLSRSEDKKRLVFKLPVQTSFRKSAQAITGAATFSDDSHLYYRRTFGERAGLAVTYFCPGPGAPPAQRRRILVPFLRAVLDPVTCAVAVDTLEKAGWPAEDQEVVLPDKVHIIRLKVEAGELGLQVRLSMAPA